ncbi:MAG: aminopeptidase N, partial [Flavobacterium sp.]
FGQYPFYEDGYKLVETPYLGMEHQSAVAYGNQYKKGYMGRDLSGTGIGLSFDFITIHETGHEWFGNSITSKDIADMWIHEAFTTYSESVFLECTQGYELAQKYINGQAKNILNDKPVIGFYGVNKEGSGDMYNKGALMLNTLRHITNNDSKWWTMLLKYSNTYKKQIIDTKTVIDFFSQELGHDMTPFFNQYLKHTTIPVLVLKKHKNTFKYKWQTDEPNFEMPIEIEINGINKRVLVTNEFQISPIQVVSIPNEIKVRTDKYYIKVY